MLKPLGEALSEISAGRWRQSESVRPIATVLKGLARSWNMIANLPASDRVDEVGHSRVVCQREAVDGTSRKRLSHNLLAVARHSITSMPSARLMANWNLLVCTYRKVGRLGALEDLTPIGAGRTKHIRHIGS